jgi:two-component system copper resistance phosphate regulon response regulator CusR
MSTQNNTKQILIVDDDHLLRNFFSKVISAEGYHAVVACDGDDAISQLDSNKDFCLFIVDLLLPVRSGWEVIEYIKSNEKFRRIPIIALTGLADSFDEISKVKESCDAVLHKGNFELTDFLALINSLVKKPTSM